jgi:hypothetical protein
VRARECCNYLIVSGFDEAWIGFASLLEASFFALGDYPPRVSGWDKEACLTKMVLTVGHEPLQ